MSSDLEKRALEIAGRVAATREAAASLPFSDDIVALVRAAAANAPAGQLRASSLRVTVLDIAAQHFEGEAAKPGAHALTKIMANELRAMQHECFEDIKHEMPAYLEQEERAAASVAEQLLDALAKGRANEL